MWSNAGDVFGALINALLREVVDFGTFPLPPIHRAWAIHGEVGRHTMPRRTFHNPLEQPPDSKDLQGCVDQKSCPGLLHSLKLQIPSTAAVVMVVVHRDQGFEK